MTVKKPGELSAKQKRFALEYIKDMNATQAYIRAGYAKKGAAASAARLLTNANIQAFITERTQKVLDKAALTADQVLEELSKIAMADMRQLFVTTDFGVKLLAPDEWPDHIAGAVAGIDVITVNKGEGEVEHVAKIKRSDRLRALELLGKYHALFKDKIEIDVHDSVAAKLAAAKVKMGNGGSKA